MESVLLDAELSNHTTRLLQMHPQVLLEYFL